MNNNIQYYPIIKWKAGERKALEYLNDMSDMFTPIIEIVEDTTAEKFFKELSAVYDAPIMLDISHCANLSNLSYANFFDYAICNEIEFIPVITYDNLNLVTKLPSNEIALKLGINDTYEGSTTESILTLLNKLYPDKRFSIILDGGVILKKEDANNVYQQFCKLISTSCLLSFTFSNIIIALTSFPEDPFIPAGENKAFKRFDIEIYKNIRKKFSGHTILYKLRYADYGVTKFTDSDLDFSKMRNGILPKIKYTTFNKYIVLKGKRGNSPRTSNDMAEEIINSDYYFGKYFSFGDLDIYSRGKRENGPGSNQQWVTINANHHISVVLEQLSNLDDFLM